MARVKTGVVRRRRHKKVLKLARGFFSARHKHFRKAKEQLERSLVMHTATDARKNVISDVYGSFVSTQLAD